MGGRAPNRGDGGDGGRTMLLPLRGVRTSLSLPAPQRVAKVTELLLLLLVVMMLLLLLLQDSGTTLRVAGRGRESCTDKGRHRERERGERGVQMGPGALAEWHTDTHFLFAPHNLPNEACHSASPPFNSSLADCHLMRFMDER